MGAHKNVFERAAYGLDGFRIIADTVLYTPDKEIIYAIKAVNGSAVIQTATGTFDGATIAGDRILEGDVLVGEFTSLQLTSGKVYAYKRRAA